MSTTRPLVTQKPVPEFQQLRTELAPTVLPESSSQCPELRRIASVTPCDRFLVRLFDGVFTTFAPICSSHGWAGHAEGSEHGASAQICEGHVHQMIASSRAAHLLRQGFTRVEGE